jgi:hypothetical protein
MPVATVITDLLAQQATADADRDFPVRVEAVHGFLYFTAIQVPGVCSAAVTYIRLLPGL